MAARARAWRRRFAKAHVRVWDSSALSALKTTLRRRACLPEVGEVWVQQRRVERSVESVGGCRREGGGVREHHQRLDGGAKRRGVGTAEE